MSESARQHGRPDRQVRTILAQCFNIPSAAEHPLRADDAVLDVGSGSGILSLVAAQQAVQGSVVAVDADCRAVDGTQRTLAHNQVAHAEALVSDCAYAVRKSKADSWLITMLARLFHRLQQSLAVIFGDSALPQGGGRSDMSIFVSIKGVPANSMLLR